MQEIIKRCKSAEDLKLAVDAMDKLMRFRRAEQHHKPFNAHTGKMLTEVGSCPDRSVPYFELVTCCGC